MQLIWAIIIGFLAGLIAKALTSNRTPTGFIGTTVLGIVGSVVATWLGQAIGWYRPGESAGFVGAIVGAVVVLSVYHAIGGRRA